ncbi:hypothetical protein IAU59_004235 [Kwoniella sp. CBS 9459]
MSMRIEPQWAEYDSDYYESGDEFLELSSPKRRSRGGSVSSLSSYDSAGTASTAPTDYSPPGSVAGFEHDDPKLELEDLLDIHHFKSPGEFDTLGGHAGGILVSENNEFILKKTDKDEISFYGRVAAGDPPVRAIAPHLPEYFGSVDHPSTEQQASTIQFPKKFGTIFDAELGIKPLEKTNTASTHEQSVILSNVLHGFDPRTVTCWDVKIGDTMHTSDASEEKRKQMIGQVEKSTSKHYALRHVWGETAVQSDDGQWSKVRAGKKYGYSLRKHDGDTDAEETLDDAIARYFPIPGDVILPKDDETMAREAEARKIRNTTGGLSQSAITKTDATGDASMNTRVQPSSARSLSVLPAPPNSLVGGESKARILAERRAAIKDMREIVENTNLELADMSEAIRNTQWKYTGSSIFIAHGVPEDDDESFERTDPANGRGSRTFSVISWPYEPEDEWNIDIAHPDLTKPVLSPQATMDSRFTSTTVPETSTLPRARRKVSVVLLDHARGEYSPEGDPGSLKGISNLQAGLRRRLNTLASEEAKCVSELSAIRSQARTEPSILGTGSDPSAGISRTHTRRGQVAFSPLPTIRSEGPSSGLSASHSRQRKSRLSHTPTSLAIGAPRSRGLGRGSWSMSRDEGRSTLDNLRRTSSFANISTSHLSSALVPRMF